MATSTGSSATTQARAHPTRYATAWHGPTRPGNLARRVVEYKDGDMQPETVPTVRSALREIAGRSTLSDGTALHCAKRADSLSNAARFASAPHRICAAAPCIASDEVTQLAPLDAYAPSRCRARATLCMLPIAYRTLHALGTFRVARSFGVSGCPGGATRSPQRRWNIHTAFSIVPF